MKYRLVESTDNLNFEAKLIDINYTQVKPEAPFEPALMFDNKVCMRLDDVVRSGNVMIEFEGALRPFGELTAKKLVSLIGKKLSFKKVNRELLITL